MRDPFKVYTTFLGDKDDQLLDWEESAADSRSPVEDIHDADRKTPSLAWLALSLVAVFLVIGTRMFYLQVIKGQEFRMLSENNRIRKQSILAPRGKILDRNGNVLAQNEASYNLVATPFDLPKSAPELEQEVLRLAEKFSLDPQGLLSLLKSSPASSIQPVVVKSDLSQQESILFETLAEQFPGFSLEKIPVRDYPEALMFSHVIGYTGLVSPGDLDDLNKERYDVLDYVGKLGVEAQYEEYLHGTNGRNLVEVDATGKVKTMLGEQSPVPGRTAVLNLDKGLQEMLYSGLMSSKNSQRGAAVALDPRTGEVLALVSTPGFDNNLFAHGITASSYQALLNDKSQPLFHRAIAGVYPPGSTVKPMVAGAALEERLVTERTVINDRGLLVIPNQFNPAISYNFYGWKRTGLGPMTVTSAIAMSSDIYFYTIAGGYPNSPVERGLGVERLSDYYRRFGLGSPIGIDLPGEKPGRVADPKWKSEYYRNNPIMGKWYLGDTYHVAIGQGDMLTTPLQVAQWTAIIANNGIGYRPRVLNRVIDSSGQTIFRPAQEIQAKDVFSADVLKIVQEGMRETVLDGTAKRLQELSISSAGKTGTSQFDGSDPSRTHAWLTVYAPYEDPQIVVTVLVEAGGEGSAAAEPIIRNALKWWVENRYRP